MSPASFSSVTSTNVKISPQNFLNISFTYFVTLMQNFKVMPSASPKTVPQKSGFSGQIFKKIEVMITSLIEVQARFTTWSLDHMYNVIRVT